LNQGDQSILLLLNGSKYTIDHELAGSTVTSLCGVSAVWPKVQIGQDAKGTKGSINGLYQFVIGPMSLVYGRDYWFVFVFVKASLALFSVQVSRLFHSSFLVAPKKSRPPI
jgi:hypothetical protein